MGANSFRVRPEPASLEGFTLIGVTLSVLQRLRGLARERQDEAGPPSAIRSGGSRQAGEELTTADVCYEIVRPATEGRRCPYCELAEAGEMGTAQAFVSHAWLYPFELLVSALEEAAMPPETFFWVDIAVVNQHTNATRGFDWWSGTFRMAVKHIGLTLLVLAPWRKAVTLERAWCIWEVRPVACLSRGPPPLQPPPPPIAQPFGRARSHMLPPPPSAPAEASRKTKPMVEDEEATDSSSDLSLDDDQRYDELATTESLSGRSPSDVLRIASALKPLVAAAKKPNLFAETCASLEPGESVKASAVKLILSVVGVLSDGVVLAVFDGQEEDVAELAQLRAVALREDVTRAKEAKARADEEARQAELAAAAAAPKTTKEVVSELNLLFKLRDKCRQTCPRWGDTSTICTCEASDSWTSSVKLLDITGKKLPVLHFSVGTPIQVRSLALLKLRLRPEGGGSGEDAVALLQQAARAARDKAGWEGDVNLASK